MQQSETTNRNTSALESDDASNPQSETSPIPCEEFPYYPMPKGDYACCNEKKKDQLCCIGKLTKYKDCASVSEQCEGDCTTCQGKDGKKYGDDRGDKCCEWDTTGGPKFDKGLGQFFKCCMVKGQPKIPQCSKETSGKMSCSKLMPEWPEPDDPDYCCKPKEETGSGSWKQCCKHRNMKDEKCEAVGPPLWTSCAKRVPGYPHMVKKKRNMEEEQMLQAREKPRRRVFLTVLQGLAWAWDY